MKEEELLLADELKNIIQKTREGLGENFDPQDPKFISLKEELERLFKKKNLTEVSKEEMEKNIKALNEIYNKAKELDRKNQLLKAKYNNDEKYASEIVYNTFPIQNIDQSKKEKLTYLALKLIDEKKIYR